MYGLVNSDVQGHPDKSNTVLQNSIAVVVGEKCWIPKRLRFSRTSEIFDKKKQVKVKSRSYDQK